MNRIQWQQSEHNRRSTNRNNYQPPIILNPSSGLWILPTGEYCTKLANCHEAGIPLAKLAVIVRDLMLAGF